MKKYDKQENGTNFKGKIRNRINMKRIDGMTQRKMISLMKVGKCL